MKYSLRSLMAIYVLVSYFISGIWFALMAIGFAILAPLVILEIGGHPAKTVSSIVVAECIAAVVLWVGRLVILESWKGFAELRQEPPSFGRPPALPDPSAPAPNPPKP